jgi:hypothetical protein
VEPGRGEAGAREGWHRSHQGCFLVSLFLGDEATLARGVVNSRRTERGVAMSMSQRWSQLGRAASRLPPAQGRKSLGLWCFVVCGVLSRDATGPGAVVPDWRGSEMWGRVSDPGEV